MSAFHQLNDEQLLFIINDHNAESSGAINELMDRYKEEVRGMARSFYLIGSDQQDLLQEGMIGLYKAILGYDSGKGLFRHFARVCISRQLTSALRSSLREKNRPLNEAVSLDLIYRNEEGEETSWAESLPELSVSSSEDEALDVNGEQELLRRIRSLLSPMEDKVLLLYLDGYDQRDIANQMLVSDRSVENAISRIRRKTRNHLADMLKQ